MDLKNVRLNKCFTLKDVANDIDISLSQLSKIERGLTSPAPDVKEKLINYYKFHGYSDTIVFPDIPDSREKLMALRAEIQKRDDEIESLRNRLTHAELLLDKLARMLDEGAKICKSA